MSLYINSDRKKGLLSSSLVVSVMTMLSRGLGLVRDIVIAQYFGSSFAADAFFVAFRIPNFFRRLFAEGAFSQAFVPVLSQTLAKEGQVKTKELVRLVSGSLFFSLLLFTGIAILFSPVIISIFAPGFYANPEKFNLAKELLVMTFPYLLFISLAGLYGSVLNANRHFVVPAFTPVLLNVSLIGSVILFSHYFHQPIFALGWGVMVAGILQLVLQVLLVYRYGFLALPKVAFNHPQVKRIIRLMIPALFSVSVSQISLLIDTLLASFLPTGSISWLYYADRIAELPLGVFGVAIATVILPHLSKQHAQQQAKHFSQTLDWAIRLVLLIGVPAVAGLLMLSHILISVLFLRGAMTPHDMLMASHALSAYAIGLIAFMFIKILAPGFFAQENMTIPVKVAVWSMLFNIVMNFIFIIPLKHVGLALATSLSGILNAGGLFYYLLKKSFYKPEPGFLNYFCKVMIATTIMILTLWLLLMNKPFNLLHSNIMNIITVLSLVIIAVMIYGVSLWGLGLRLKHFKLSN